MKTSIVTAIQNQFKASPRFLEQFAKRMVLMKLENISQGFIQIIDNDQIYAFGDEASTLHSIVTIRNNSFYHSLAFAGSVGAGEAYFQGEWDCDSLTNLVRIFVLNRNILDNLDTGSNLLSAFINKALHLLNSNTRNGSRRNIAAHYDIGNDLFKLMLDSKMMYSSAVYPDDKSELEKAATHKIDVICKKLKLTEKDHLLEIGTGWGGFAVHAAKNYGCHVTTTTISQEQYNYAKNYIYEQGLEDKITLLLKDYRDLTGQFDKLVSIEMIEAVGLNNLNTYFRKCSSLLKESGIMCLQSITIEDQRYERAKREVDFIQKYIFPGGSLPSVTAISESVTKVTDMCIYNLEDIGLHYAKTLNDWRARFFNNKSQIIKLGYNETFTRLWEFYLCYCEGAFAERATSAVHILLIKPRYRKNL